MISLLGKIVDDKFCEVICFIYPLHFSSPLWESQGSLTLGIVCYSADENYIISSKMNP